MLKDAYGENRANKTLQGTRANWESCSDYEQPLTMFFKSVFFQTPIILFQNKIWLSQKDLLLSLLSQLSVGKSRLAQLN